MNLDNMTIVRNFMDTYTPLIEQRLSQIFPKGWQIPDKLKQSINYSLLSGGKRIRPLMVIAAARAIKGEWHAEGADAQGTGNGQLHSGDTDGQIAVSGQLHSGDADGRDLVNLSIAEKVLPVACAVELVHTYSLIHDDLPAMDDDDYRRGRLTNHKVYGEDMAILAGDGLLTHAFYLLVNGARKQGIDSDIILDIVEDLSEYAGVRGMVGGQAADMLGEQGVTDLDQLTYIHLHKTSDLLVFSLLAGARCAGANERQLAALTEYGRSIGLAYQIQDDILDVIGEEDKLGKRTKSDEEKSKVTWPFFIGLEASQAKVRELTEAGKRAIMEGDLEEPEILLAFADYLLNRDR